MIWANLQQPQHHIDPTHTVKYGTESIIRRAQEAMTIIRLGNIGLRNSRLKTSMPPYRTKEQA
jgi:hypothetical protein